MRSLLLFLSRQKQLRRWAETAAIARQLSSRFIAGASLSDALPAVQKIRSEGIAITLDYLGEGVTSVTEAAACRDEYLRAIDALTAAGIEPNVSLKLTQFGLDLNADLCRQNVEALVSRVAPQNGFVRVDMESSEYTDRTLDLVYHLHSRIPNTGTVIQAYLHRSERDIEELCSRRIRVRLCKGAYLEPASVAFPNKADVDRNFVNLMKRLLEAGTYPAIATHDEAIIEEGCRFVRERNIARDSFEFQMLYGIRRDLQRKLTRDGFRLRLYVPYGEAWYPYFMRRLAERPANVVFLARNLLR